MAIMKEDWGRRPRSRITYIFAVLRAIGTWEGVAVIWGLIALVFLVLLIMSLFSGSTN